MQFLEVPIGGGRERERLIENLKGLWDFFYSLFANFECVVKCDIVIKCLKKVGQISSAVR